MKPEISTRNLDLLPNIDSLKKLLQSLATLDLIMSPDEWEYRYYSFDSKWSAGEQMGSMRNGMGDEFFALFNSSGCFIKGFAHESQMTPHRVNPPEPWPGVLEKIPDEFTTAKNEPAFSMENVTFCIWRRYSDDAWSHGPIDFPEGDDVDGSIELLTILDKLPSTYCQYAEEYFESKITSKSVQHVYDHKSLSKSVIASLNSEVILDNLNDSLDDIGYVVAEDISASPSTNASKPRWKFW